MQGWTTGFWGGFFGYPVACTYCERKEASPHVEIAFAVHCLQHPTLLLIADNALPVPLLFLLLQPGQWVVLWDAGHKPTSSRIVCFYSFVIWSFTEKSFSVFLFETGWTTRDRNYLSHIMLLLSSYIETVKVSVCLKPPQMRCFPKHGAVMNNLSGTMTKSAEY